MDYNRLLQAVLDIAEEMLVCGAEVSRVEDSIERMCVAYGCDYMRINAFIITSNIQVSLEDPDGNIITQIRRILRSDVDFDKLDYLNDLSRYICANKPSVEEIREKFDQVMARKHYPYWILGLGSALAAGSFAVFFGGSLTDGAAAAVTGIGITIMLNLLGRIERNQLAKTFIVSFLAGVMILLMIHLGFGNNADKIMIGSIMLLIPGIAMTNSVRDMLIGDIVSGMLRLTNSLIQAAAIACGFALSMLVMGGVAI
ncbi:MAG: threonine/serine exporter family protein [Firmicutes bacterium]|nr:threonine/serine exporter family protein [Bacillota bacterium]